MMKAKNIIIGFCLLVSGFFVFAKGVIPGWQEGRSDFSNYYASAVLITEGESISKFYNNDWFSNKSKKIGLKDGAKFAPFPPATAFLYLPLTMFDALMAKRVWLICNLLILVLLVFELKKIGTLNWFEILFALSLFSIPIASNIKLGQSYLLFTFFITKFLVSNKKDDRLMSSSLLGMAASIKYFPVIYLAYEFPKFKKISLIGFSAGVGLLLFLPILFFGLEPYHVFLTDFWNHLNGNLSGQGQFAISFQSIDVLLANLFIYNAEQNPTVLIDLPILKTILKLLFALAIVWFSYQAIKDGITKTKDLSIGIAIIGASLLIPASATYHLLFLVPAVILIINWLIVNERSTFFKALVVGLIFLICNFMAHYIPDFTSVPNLNVILHFPRLYDLLGLFVLLIILQRRYLHQNV